MCLYTVIIVVIRIGLPEVREAPSVLQWNNCRDGTKCDTVALWTGPPNAACEFRLGKFSLPTSLLKPKLLRGWRFGHKRTQ